MLLRIVIATVFLGFVLWFGFSESSVARRSSSIAAALKHGELGGLNKSETDDLLKELRWLATNSGVEKPVSLNLPISTNHLNIYTCLPGSERIAFCPPGNAVYDVELDAIFVDVGIVKPSELWILGQDPPEPDRYKSPDAIVYRRFVLLHEIGHRQKRHRSAMVYDAVPISAVAPSQKLELEADQFAYDRMVLAYAQAIKNDTGNLMFPRFVGEAPSLSANAVIEDNSNANECVAIDVASMSINMSWMSFYSSSQYAPFFQDSEHPLFPLRAGVLVAKAKSDAVISPTARGAIQNRSQILDGILRTRLSGCTQIIFPAPIRDLAFAPDGLVMVALNNATYRIPLKKVSPPPPGMPLRVYRVQAPIIAAADGPSLNLIFGLASGGCGGVDNNGNWYRCKNDQWLPWSDIRVPLDFGRLPRFVLPPEPSPFIVVEPPTVDAESLQVIWETGRVSTLKFEELVIELKKAGVPGVFEIMLNRADSNQLFFEIYSSFADRKRQFYGIATVESTNFHSVSIQRCKLPSTLQTADLHGRIVAYQSGSVTEGLLVDAGVIPKRPWSLWRLSANQPELLARSETLSSATQAILSEEDEIQRLLWVPPNRLLINGLGNTFLIDAKRNRSSILLSPGVPRMRVRSDGFVLMFEIAGHKAYLYNLNR